MAIRLISWCRSWPTRIALLAAPVLLLGLAGCATRMEPVAEEHDAIRDGKTTLVLVRVTCSVEGQPQDCFGKFTWTEDGPIVAFGLGSFKTVGEPQPEISRFLSEESRTAGWFFFLVPPGAYYLAVAGPLSGVSLRGDLPTLLRAGPRWRIDVPENTKLVYAGTITLSGRNAGALMFGGRIIQPDGADGAAAVSDEAELARRLLARHLEAGWEMKTNLMIRWRPGEPLIIRSPKTGSMKGTSGQNADGRDAQAK